MLIRISYENCRDRREKAEERGGVADGWRRFSNRDDFSDRQRHREKPDEHHTANHAAVHPDAPHFRWLAVFLLQNAFLVILRD